MPDAVGYAVRLALAMVLAYFVSFTIQLESASTAGVCVGIVMQPSPGMAVSKAFYRTLGTLAGGMAALVIVAFFPQDRTMLLLATAGWLAACTYAASLLRDFRAYGAVLSGYTVAVIAVGQIMAPANVLLTTLDRVAAILVGVLCVALVNAVFVVATAHAQLVDALQLHLAQARDTALAVLDTGARPLRDVSLDRTSALLALRTDATYASAELADGLRHSRAATAAIAALLDMMAASRELGRALGSTAAVAPDTRAYLVAVADAVRTDAPPPALPTRPPPAPLDALLTERATALVLDHVRARQATVAATTGQGAGQIGRVRIPSDPDHTAAMLNGARAAIATGLGAILCVMGGDPTTVLLLIQLAAFVSLLGLQPDPSTAAGAFLPGLPLAAAMAGGLVFGVLPLASGFGTFALGVGPAVFLIGLVSRHPATARFGPGVLIYFTILLSPANVQIYNPIMFANLVLQLAVAAVLTSVVFRLVLPVNPRRRLVQVAARVVASLRRGLQEGRQHEAVRQPSLEFDRLAQALLWSRVKSSLAQQVAAPAVLSRLAQFSELDAAACRAWRGLRTLGIEAPGLVRAAEAALAGAEPDAMDAAARDLLAQPGTPATADAVLRAVSGLHGAALLVRLQGPALYRYGVLRR